MDTVPDSPAYETALAASLDQCEQPEESAEQYTHSQRRQYGALEDGDEEPPQDDPCRKPDDEWPPRYGHLRSSRRLLPSESAVESPVGARQIPTRDRHGGIVVRPPLQRQASAFVLLSVTVC